MDIVQTFYNNLAPQYDKLFLDWESATAEQATMLDHLFKRFGFDRTATILDCACGIGTQAIGLAALGYDVTASDISNSEILEATKRAAQKALKITFKQADFRNLDRSFSSKFDIVIAMDNALPHMLDFDSLSAAVKSIASQTSDNGIFVASIRDYDELLKTKPTYSVPYIYKTEKGQRVSFQTWEWKGDNYRLVQYIIEDDETVRVNKFECEYRATRRGELTELLLQEGYKTVQWFFPEDSGFYQPIVVAQK